MVGNDAIGAALAAIDELVAVHPLVLLVDDVQWADGLTQEILAAIVRRASEIGVVVVIASRDFPRSPEMARLAAATETHGTRAVIDALPDERIAELTEAMLDARPTARLLDTLAGTSGNPFLTVEFLRSLQADGSLVFEGGTADVVANSGLPRSLGERLARDALDATAGDDLLIRAAAVLPGGFTIEELAEIVGRPMVAVIADVLRLTESQVVTERSPFLAFRHDIIRQAVVDATPDAVVRALNRLAIDVLEHRSADPERLVGCWLLAADLQDPGDVTAMAELGLELRQRSPYAAAEVLTAVIAALAADDPRRIELSLALGWTLNDLGRLAEAAVAADEAYVAVGDRLDVRRLRGEIMSLRGTLHKEFTPLPASFDLATAVDEIGGDASTVVAELSMLEMLAGRIDVAQRFVDWVDSHGPMPPEAELYTCETRAILFGRTGHYEQGLAVAERGLTIAADHPGIDTSRARPTTIAAIMYDALGRGDEALALLRGVDAFAGPLWNVPLVQTSTAVTLFRRGEWDDALAEVAAGLAAADELGVRLGTAWPYSVMILINLARGDSGAARSWMARAHDDVGPGSLGLEWLMYAAAMQTEADGDLPGALATLRTVVDVAIEVGAPAILLNLSPDVARLAYRVGDEQLVSRITDVVHDLTGNTASPVVEAFATWCRAWHDLDPSLAASAARLVEPAGRAADRSRMLHDAAVIAAELGDHDAARSTASEAFALYDVMRAEHHHARLRAELRAAGLSMRPRRSPRRPSSGWRALTATEQRVVELVGEGNTNSQIAEQLFVSRRTVESHLASAYPKLGFLSRTELVVAAHSRQQRPTGT